MLRELRISAGHFSGIAADAGQQLGGAGVLQGSPVGAQRCAPRHLLRDGVPPPGEQRVHVGFVPLVTCRFTGGLAEQVVRPAGRMILY